MRGRDTSISLLGVLHRKVVRTGGLDRTLGGLRKPLTGEGVGLEQVLQLRIDLKISSLKARIEAAPRGGGREAETPDSSFFFFLFSSVKEYVVIEELIRRPLLQKKRRSSNHFTDAAWNRSMAT